MNILGSSNSFLLSLLLLLMTAYACSSNVNTKITRGSDYNFEVGVPEFRVSAIGLFNSDVTPGIDLSVDLVESSLIYKNKDNLFIGEALIEIEVFDQLDEDKLTYSSIDSLQIKDPSDSIIYSEDVRSYSRFIPTYPSRYKISIKVTDLATDKSLSYSTETTLPDPDSEIADISHVKLMTKETPGSDFKPVTTYNISTNSDTVRFHFQVTNNKNSELVLRTRLIQYISDTTIAKSATDINYRVSSIQYQGILYDEPKIVERFTRNISTNGFFLISYNFSDLEEANYRFTSELIDEDGTQVASTIREFSIKSPGYPSITTPREFAEPLFYLMRKEEYNDLMSIKDPEELKQAADRFWLSNIQNSQLARDIIRLYYQRVEEANKQFDSYKEGWKTDPGYIYILFGPPFAIEYRFDSMIWYYSYNRNDPVKTYRFVQEKINNKYFPFDNYILQRDSRYFQEEYSYRRAWLNGSILYQRM